MEEKTYDFAVPDCFSLDLRYVASDYFTIGAYMLEINFYPRNQNKPKDVSIFVKVIKGWQKNLKVVFRFAILSKNLKFEDCTLRGPFTINEGTKTFGYPNFCKRDELTAIPSPIIRCYMKIRKEEDIPRALSQHDCLRCEELLEKQTLSDISFMVGDERFYAHKVILCMKSAVFKTQFLGAWINGQSITLEEIEPNVFKALLHFIYTNKIPDFVVDVLVMQNLVAAADRFGIDELKVMCEHKLSESIDLENVALNMKLAVQHNLSHLKVRCAEFFCMPDMCKAVIATTGYQSLYTTCPAAIEEFVTSACAWRTQ